MKICFKSWEDIEKFHELTFNAENFYKIPSLEKIMDITIDGILHSVFKVWNGKQSKTVLCKIVDKVPEKVEKVEENSKDNTNIATVKTITVNTASNTSNLVENPVNPFTSSSEERVMSRQEKIEQQKALKALKRDTYIKEMVAKGFVHTPDIDDIDDDRFLYVKRDKEGHVVNTYKIKSTKNREQYLQVGVPKANDKDYTIRTYFVTDFKNFDILKDHEWKVYADNEDSDGTERYNVAYKYKNEKNKKIHTVKAIELIAINMGLEKKYIENNHLYDGYGIGTGHNARKINGETFVDGKRISVFVKDGNDFLLFAKNLKLALYADIISRKTGKGKKNKVNKEIDSKAKNNSEAKTNNETKNNSEAKSVGIKDMLKSIEELLG